MGRFTAVGGLDGESKIDLDVRVGDVVGSLGSCAGGGDLESL